MIKFLASFLLLLGVLVSPVAAQQCAPKELMAEALSRFEHTTQELDQAKRVRIHQIISVDPKSYPVPDRMFVVKINDERILVVQPAETSIWCLIPLKAGLPILDRIIDIVDGAGVEAGA